MYLLTSHSSVTTCISILLCNLLSSFPIGDCARTMWSSTVNTCSILLSEKHYATWWRCCETLATRRSSTSCAPSRNGPKRTASPSNSELQSPLYVCVVQSCRISTCWSAVSVHNCCSSSRSAYTLMWYHYLPSTLSRPHTLSYSHLVLSQCIHTLRLLMFLCNFDRAVSPVVHK